MKEHYPLNSLTTFGIGGPARYFFEIHTIEEMQEAMKYCCSRGLRYFILGKGSNSLFDDRGFNGAVIANRIETLEKIAPDAFQVGAGYSFSLLGTQTARQGYSGLEFASGIPGSVGGAIFMNAGANGRETCQSLLSVDFVTEEGELIHLKRDDLSFAYRTSCFQSRRGAIVRAIFKLTPSSTARQDQLKIIHYRKETQPYGEMSAGCVFRNPLSGHAGALIEKSGLKGASIGGAQVSTVHANFIINTGSATAKDVIALMNLVKQRVKETTDVSLESEVRLIAYQEEEKDL